MESPQKNESFKKLLRTGITFILILLVTSVTAMVVIPDSVWPTSTAGLGGLQVVFVILAILIISFCLALFVSLISYRTTKKKQNKSEDTRREL
ncbi:MAG: hypothetical protein A3B31_02905 [Candidatus Komeilibacteria bacterium RIFCSPLOWO2_01_FULL_53_11]|uniref:Uncharacterized protein n=1 Tax=Candidatus Komeilibacteria bacterium RIFCSPLOWO2_01_FULL_53_11 TaxID=1798552 RepID=A0A1G2BUP8_9BACT|nr:MAG: hypothetical protein A3B31_02905 [Candidatus Komeilibacteria bacterium RIFCSPLOWO2_01_FULL_53_11]